MQIKEDFVQEKIKELKQNEEVKAIAVVGSYARDPEQDHNDLDIFVIVEEDWSRRKTEVNEDIPLEYFYNSMNKAIEWLEGDNWWKNYHWYTNADVRYDPEGKFQELREKAQETRDEKLDLDEKDLEEIAYTVWDKKQDLDTRDVSQKRYLLNEFFNYLIFQFFRLNGEVPVKPNHRIKALEGINGYIYKLSQDFLLASSTMEKENKLEEITDYISRDLPDTAPEYETERKEN